MLKEIGVDSVEELYKDIPDEVRVRQPLSVKGMNSEYEVREHIESELAKNKSAAEEVSFLGAGIYDHYVPAAVKAVLSRTEFQTSYTPYQAEISQGMLQGLFEFQSMMADLCDVDVVNSSLYDWSTALGEAARMAVRATGRKKILVPRCLHPDKLLVLKSYSDPIGIKVEDYDFAKETGTADVNDLQQKLDASTAAVYLEVPSFFGILDSQATDIPSICHRAGALSIVGFDPVSLGRMKPPGEYGADIIVAEGQSMATGMNYGGPSLGIIGCKGETLIRQMPGRLIGQTTTVDGRDQAFSMVLQTREQHIRREKATSNICTNEALLAIGAAVYLSLMGPSGLRQLFETILAKTQYALNVLSKIPNLTIPRFASPHYQDFVVSLKGETPTAQTVQKKMLTQGIQFGKNLSSDFPELGESLLLSVTELTSEQSIDRLGLSLQKILEAA
jgi:glycine dehydrogenase subunit 1